MGEVRRCYTYWQLCQETALSLLDKRATNFALDTAWVTPELPGFSVEHSALCTPLTAPRLAFA